MIKITLSVTLGCALSSSLFAGEVGKQTSPALAAPINPGAEKAAASFSGPRSPWSVTGGFSTRRIRSDVQFGIPSGVPWLDLLGLESSGRGDVGLASPDGERQYDDGRVGEGDVISLTNFNNPSQVSATGRVDLLGDSITEVRFHSSATSHSLGFSSQDLPSESDTGVGGFLRLSGSLGDFHGFTPGLSLQWTGVRSQTGFANQQFATVEVVEERSDYAYAYDAFLLAQNFGFVIVNADGLPGSLDPRRTERSTSRTVAFVDAFATADLDVTLHELALSIDLQRYVLPRLAVALSVGPTLNFVNRDFDATVNWVVRGSGRTLLRESIHDSANDVKIGFMATLMARYDLVPSRKWYLEAHAGYHWLDDLQWQAGTASGKVELASWDFGLGVGYRF